MARNEHSELVIPILPISTTLQVVGEPGIIADLQAALSRGELSIMPAFQQARLTEPLPLRFKRLTAEWRAYARHRSSLRRIALHSSYQKIIKMGEAALPFIFQDLKANPAHWFFALETITEQKVGRLEDDFETIRAAWLNWGREHGYLAE